MIRSPMYYGLVSLMMFSFLHCHKGESPTSPESFPHFLFGVVTDTQGKALDSVGVHYIFSTVQSALQKDAKTCPSTMISFSVPHRAKVSLKIYRWYTDEFIETLLDTMENAGNYSIQLNSSNLTNGCYIFRLSIDTIFIEKHFWMLNTSIPSLITAAPLITSNSMGQFTLPLGIFGVGMQTFITGATPVVIDTVYISHAITMVLHKNGYQTLSYPLTIDTTKGFQQTFKLEKLQ